MNFGFQNVWSWCLHVWTVELRCFITSIRNVQTHERAVCTRVVMPHTGSDTLASSLPPPATVFVCPVFGFTLRSVRAVNSQLFVLQLPVLMAAGCSWSSTHPFETWSSSRMHLTVEWVSQRGGCDTFENFWGMRYTWLNIQKNEGYLYAHMLIFVVTRQLTSLHIWQHSAEIRQKKEFPDCCGIASLLYDSSTRFRLHFAVNAHIFSYGDRLHGTVSGNIHQPS
jgi:hypothetical protein